MINIDKLRAKYGKNWGLNVDERKRKPPLPAPTVEELQRFYANNPERIARLMGEGTQDNVND